jgi:hypothetical protein
MKESGGLSLLPKTQVDEAKQQTAIAVMPLVKNINEIQIKSALDYVNASVLLSNIAAVRSNIKERMAKILDPIGAAWDSATKLKKELDAPAEQAELSLRNKMRLYKLEEQQRIQAAAAEQARVAAEIERRAEEARIKEENAKTEQMRARLAAKRQQLEQEAAVAIATPAPAPVRTGFASDRPVRRLVMDHDAIIKGVIEGKIPPSAISVNEVAIRTMWRGVPDIVEAWPGIKVEDDIQIVRR